MVGGHLISDGSRETVVGAIGVSGVGPQLAAALGDIATAAIPRPLGPFTLRRRRGVTAAEAQAAARLALAGAAAERRSVAVAVTDAAGALRAMYLPEGASRAAEDIALRVRRLLASPLLRPSVVSSAPREG